MDKKYSIDSLSRASFAGMVAKRVAAIQKSPDAPVRDVESYLPNRIAAALHPKAQFLTVRDVIEHSPDMKTFVLSPNGARGTKSLAWFSAGQYLVLELEIGGKKVCRPYSIASSPREALAGVYRLTIKRVDGGIVSGWLLDHWKAGDEVVASAPMGEFTYEPLRDAKTVIGIAGGSGITPFLSFAAAIADGDEDFSLVLLYGSRTLADAVGSDQLAALQQRCGKIKVVHVLSEEEAPDCESGFITADLIKKYAPEEGEYSIFLCGPQALYRFADKEIEKLGLRRKFVRHELFGEYFHPEQNEDYPKDAAASYKVTVRMAGKETVIDCPADTSLLRAMEQAGIHAPADCRSGQCGWCHSQLLSGDVYVPASVDGRRLADRIYGYIHPCCSFPLSDLVIDVPPMPV